MDQKLNAVLKTLTPKTAWIAIACCAAFWLVGITGILRPPLTLPTAATLLWFYVAIMLGLASTLTAAGSVAVLIIHRQGGTVAGTFADPDRPGPEPVEDDRHARAPSHRDYVHDPDDGDR